MDREIVDAVSEWDSSPFSGGYDGLRGLADREFSGAVTQGTAWAFLLNGRVIGIEEGTMSSFEEADGTAYESPAQALPLLYAMQGRGEKQAQYYTNEKPISEADATLSSGNFTGYIELSENVLSGDYYTVYYGGKSMSAAFVGNSRQLLTDEEAFERADDEVGIYTVYAADLEVIDIPEPAGDTAQTTTDSSGSGESSSDQSDDTSGGDSMDADSTAERTETVGSVTPTPTSTETDADAETGGGPSHTAGDESPGAATETPPTAEPAETRGNGANSGGEATAAGSTAATTESAADDDDVFSDEAQWRNAKTIPSLDPSGDPDRNENTSGSQRSASESTAKTKQRQSAKKMKSLSRQQLQKRLKRAEEVMEKAEEQHEQLVEERDTAIAERDSAREELETVRSQLSEAEAEIERLESQLESGASADVGGMSAGGRTLSTTEALEGTNLLVRYASKGDATLEDAITGEATQEDLRANLRIEPHTTFDSEGVSVDGTPFEEFLDGRIELAFVRWLVEEFLFDIQQTGNQTHLSGIYEALPAINRAELRGTVSLGTDDEDDPIEAGFDLVVRDKRDHPIFVADFNESKQPVGGGMVDTLVRDGSEIIQRNESFAGAFAVTTSYYEGDALDAAEDATGGGLLSASRGKSFVYISRKQGFHLCLVEKLGDTFDLHVPEL